MNDFCIKCEIKLEEIEFRVRLLSDEEKFTVPICRQCGRDLLKYLNLYSKPKLKLLIET